MEVQQVHTKKKYTMSKQEWESLGKRQKLFNVLNETEVPPAQGTPVSNTLKPGTGSKPKAEKDTTKNKGK